MAESEIARGELAGEDFFVVLDALEDAALVARSQVLDLPQRVQRVELVHVLAGVLAEENLWLAVVVDRVGAELGLQLRVVQEDQIQAPDRTSQFEGLER